MRLRPAIVGRAGKGVCAHAFAVLGILGLLTTDPIAAAPSAAAGAAVDLELVLAIDVSGSVDFQEARLQRDGYVKALTSPEVVRAVSSGILRAIAVTYIEWAGEGFNTKIVGWAVIKDAESARAFAAKLAAAPIESGPWTSISGAIEAALPMFRENRFQGTRRVIDISGDGPNNSGNLVTDARAVALAAGVTINGLPIVNDRLQPSGRRQIANLDRYYASCVIGGAGSFLVVAHDFKDFARAIRRKLVFEIAGLMPPRAGGLTRVVFEYAPGCDIGERRLYERRRQLFGDP